MNILVDTQTIFSEFKQHLELKDNKRILFSGPFGTGKSTFLSEYFKEKNNVNVFKLYPVCYSVSNNEDIFELIKYDLLYQLYGLSEENKLTFINNDYSQILAFQFKFLTKVQWSPILFKLIESADKTGNFLIIKGLVDNIKEQYDKFKKEHKNEEEEILDFLYNQYSKQGNPRENDLISQLIFDLIQRLKESLPPDTQEEEEGHTKVENILIIDDLDRLDPEHIFRIFNIFSINFGAKEIENKFGFDKIIFVCDIENIKKIYTHRYGKNVDFEGYINKFYSNYPFKFDTHELLNIYLDQFIKGFTLPTTFINTSQFMNLHNNRTYIVLKSLLNSLILSKKINLRTLLNTTFYNIPEKEISFDGRRAYSSFDYPLLGILQMLQIIYEDDETVISILETLSINSDKNNFNPFNRTSNLNDSELAFTNLINLSIPFIVKFDELNTIQDKATLEPVIHNLQVEGTNTEIKFTVERNLSRGNVDYYIRFIEFLDENKKKVDINPYTILLTVFRNCKRLEFL